MAVTSVDKAKLRERMRKIGGKKERPGASAYPISLWCTSVWKRIFDLAVASTLLIILAPLLVLLTVAVRASSKGPILFRQGRMGRNRREFRIMKFRTMVCNGHDRGPVLTRAADPRITSLGRFLRKLKLDELPQLFNVLRGEMSFVGPRPQPTKLWFGPQIQELADGVLSVRPGITSNATLNFRNEEKLLETLTAEEVEDVYTRVIMPSKLKMDLEYLEKASFAGDISIMLRTVLRIFDAREEDNDLLVREHLPAFEQKRRTATAKGDRDLAAGSATD
jgi:lipopolysaccharide/colanic/teichoic acid biosynthesis glycosyltransferase